MRLDIGSGGATQRGTDFIGVDPYAEGAELRAFMWDLPFPNNSIKQIYSSHALEHVGKNDIMPTLREWKRVLMPGGELELLIPDLEWCVKHWLTHQTIGWELDIIFGNQNHEGEYHKTGFTKKIITKYLIDARFNVYSIEYIPTHGQQTIRVEAVA